MRKVLLLIFFVGISFLGFSQEEEHHERFSQNQIVIGFGGVSYTGDLGNAYDKWTGAIYAGLRFSSEKRLSTSFLMGAGSLQGQEGLNQSLPIEVNRFFQTSFFQVNFEAQYDVLRFNNTEIFVSQGIGLFRFDPKDETGLSLRNMVSTRNENESYGNVVVFLPFSLGVRHSLSNGLGFHLQISVLNPFTDYLDNISQLGNRSGFDNVLSCRFGLLVPFQLPSPAGK